MKRQLFFHSLLIAVGALVFGGCNQDDDSGNPAKGEMIEVRFTVDGVSDYAGDTSADTRAPAEPFRVSVPMNENYEIEATFVPLQAERTRAIGPLGENIRYRVLAYSGGATYSGYADYKIIGWQSVLVNGGLRLMAGQYKFVAYSYSKSDMILDIPDENININGLAVSTDDDFLFWQSGLINISGDTSLTIGFQHLFSQLQVEFDSSGLGSNFASASAVLTVGNTAPYINGIWAVTNKEVSIVTTTQTDGAFSLPIFGSQHIMSNEKILLPISNTASIPLDLTVGATFANGETVSNKKLSLAVANNELKPNTSYLCSVKFKSSVIDIEGNEIDGYPYGGGNCWVISKNNTKDVKYSFIAVEGRTDDRVGTTVGGTPNSAGVVWQMDRYNNTTTDLIKNVVYDSSTNRMTFTVGSGQTGNAIIAVKAGSTILWSWHIWVVDDNSFLLNPVDNGWSGGIFMDRNLGAFNSSSTSDSYGLYYQWGRKDPFSTHIGNISSTPLTILETIKNPTVFVASSKWYSEVLDHSLWNWDVLYDPLMLRYNPCPKGWTVPQGSDFNYMVSSSTSDNFTEEGAFVYSTLTFPPAGRIGINGGIHDDNSNGYWSANSFEGEEAGYLEFSNKKINWFYGGGEGAAVGYGMPVRCVVQPIY